MIYLDTVLSLLPSAFFTFKLTLYLLTLVYLCTEFWFFEVLPSPNLQDHELGDPVLLSSNLTVNGAFPDVGYAENAAIEGTNFAGRYKRQKRSDEHHYRNRWEASRPE